MIDFKSFVDQWKRMPDSSGNTYLALNIEHPLKFQVGYHTNGHKSLAVMQVDDSVPIDIPSSYAITATIRPLINGAKVLEFQLTHNSFEEIFLRLCWDMIDFSAAAETPLKALVSRYLSWQKLLQRAEDSVLSKSAQKGLIGELFYLQDMIKRFGTEKALLSWTGPNGGDQDFVLDDFWTEVKTTSAASDTVTISSLEQLNQAIPGTLTVYKLEETTPGENSISLTKKANEIRNVLNSDALNFDRFEIKLLMYGYKRSDEDKYNELQFRFISRNDYDVKKDFPRLTRKNVPHEIIKCSYTFSLAALEPFRR